MPVYCVYREGQASRRPLISCHFPGPLFNQCRLQKTKKHTKQRNSVLPACDSGNGDEAALNECSDMSICRPVAGQERDSSGALRQVRSTTHLVRCAMVRAGRRSVCKAVATCYHCSLVSTFHCDQPHGCTQRTDCASTPCTWNHAPSAALFRPASSVSAVRVASSSVRPPTHATSTGRP